MGRHLLRAIPRSLLWARLPVQGLLIARVGRARLPIHGLLIARVGRARLPIHGLLIARVWRVAVR